MIPTRVRVAAFLAVVIVLVVTAITAAILDLDTGEWIALASMLFSMLAYAAVLYGLYAAFSQLRKSMARPLIKVAYDETGRQHTTLTREGAGLPPLWLINEGNAVARYFQIDFIVPASIGKQSRYVSIARDDGKYIISYTNDGKYTLFVNRPYLDPNMVYSAAIDTTKCFQIDEDSFEIEYRVYGDWVETQEGKLKFNIERL